MVEVVDGRTTMYSVNGDGSVIRHRLPFDYNDKVGKTKFSKYTDRGFTFYHPDDEEVEPVLVIEPIVIEEVDQVEEATEILEEVVEQVEAGQQEKFKCLICGFGAKSLAGLNSHRRIKHK